MFSIKIIALVALWVTIAKSQESNDTNFVATKDWQEIKPGKIEIKDH